MLKKILLQFTELYNTTCEDCRVEDKFFVCIKTKSPRCIHKTKQNNNNKNWNAAFAFKHLWLDLQIRNLLFPLKFHQTTLERHPNDLKYFVTMSLWQPNDLSTMLCRKSFLVQCLLSTCWKLYHFLESVWFFFYDFHTMVYLMSLCNWKATRVPVIIFIALMASPMLTEERDHGNVSNGHITHSRLCVSPISAPTMLDASS